MECEFKVGDYVSNIVVEAFGFDSIKQIVAVSLDKPSGVCWIKFASHDEWHPSTMFAKVNILKMLRVRLNEA